MVGYFVVGLNKNVVLMTSCDADPCPHPDGFLSCVLVGTSCGATGCQDTFKIMKTEYAFPVLQSDL